MMRTKSGTWKVNNTLLDDDTYIEIITECVPRVLVKYQEVESLQLLWELIKMEIRTETITYSKAKRKESKNRETYLQEKLDALATNCVMEVTISTKYC